MRTSSRGIAAVFLAVIIVIVVAVAGVAAYVALSSGSSSSTTTSSSPSSTTAASSTTTTTSSLPLTTTSSTVPTTTTTTSTTSTPTTSVLSSSSSTSSSSSATFSCTSTSATTTSTTNSSIADYTPQFIALIQQFSSIQFQANATENSKPYSETFGYTTTTIQSGIYNVSASLTANGTTINSFFVVDSNNDSVISATESISGYTYTVYGAEAKSFFDSSMGLYGLQEYFSSDLGVFTDSAYFTDQGTTTQTFGTVSFPVTTWVANSPNEIVSYCGVSATLTAYTLSVGTPPGTTLQFLTYLHFAGTANGSSEDITFKLTSMTVRS